MIKLGAAQIAASTSTADNLERIEKSVAQARDRNVDVLVLPEYSSYWDPEEFGRGFIENAQSATSGEFVTKVRELATDASMWIVAGMLETAPESSSRVFNTVVVISPSGLVELTYRKIHLYDAYGGSESAYLIRGNLDQRTSFKVGELTFGVWTCYDVRFPEIMRQNDAIVDALILPAVWTPGPLKHLHWQTLTRARAIENIAYLAAVTPPPPESIGQSCVLNPDGTVLERAGDQDALLVVELSAGVVRAERERNTSLDNRRYQVMGDKK